MRRAIYTMRFLLLPFAWLYGAIVRVRNLLYDRQYFSAYQPPVPVICVGNLAVGGTGKTPMVEYLARLLRDRNIAILSRGYKRETKGFVLGTPQATARSIGDEPFQYLQGLPQVTVAVCESREKGIKMLLELKPDLDLILLDDAYQHRAVRASTYLLLTDYSRLFTEDYLLPVGRLREHRSGAERAQALVVTKCPAHLPEESREKIKDSIRKYTLPGTPIFFSKIVYGAAVPFGQVQALGKKLVLVTGIANALPLVQYLSEQGLDIIHHFELPDHAPFTSDAVKEVVAFWGQQRDQELSVLMTHKDAVKWQTPELEYIWRGLPLFYLPITVTFEPHSYSFDDFIRQRLGKAGNDINS